MKHLFSFLFFVICINVYSQEEDHIISIDPNSQYVLDGLNSKHTDAYPHIFNNGKSMIYYSIIVSENTEKQELILSEWDENTKKFVSKGTFLNLDNIEFLGAWINEQMTELYYVNDHQILSMPLINGKPSGNPKKIEINGLTSFISGISFTPDMKTLVLYNHNEERNISILSLSSNGTYNLDYILELPEDYDASPGVLSRDGLSYFCSLRDSIDNDRIGVYTRTSLTEKFTLDHFNYLYDTNGNEIMGYQMAVNTDNNTMVYVNSINHTWQGNDMYLINYTTQKAIKEIDPILSQIAFEIPTVNAYVPEIDMQLVDTIPFVEDIANVLEPINTNTIIPKIESQASKIQILITKTFPNPFTELIRFQFSETLVDGTLEVYDLAGKLMYKSIHVNSNYIDMHRNELPKGLYIYRISDKADRVSTGRIIAE